MKIKMISRAFTLAGLVCLVGVSQPALSDITDLTQWSYYTDPSSPPTSAQSSAMTGSAGSTSATLGFIDDVDIPAGFDIGYSSVDANTVGSSSSGYFFARDQSFSIGMNYQLTLVNPQGLVALGLGVGTDNEGTNSAGITLGVGTLGTLAVAQYQGTARNNDISNIKGLSSNVAMSFSSPSQGTAVYSGSLSVSYDAVSGQITVGAGPASIGNPAPSPTGIATFSLSELNGWPENDGLLVSFFLRSDSVSPFTAWTGESAMAAFSDFTVRDGQATVIPEPGSFAMIALLAGLTRRRPRRL